MKLLQELCSEEAIKNLKITPKTNLLTLRRIASLQNKETFTIYVERFDGRNIGIIVKSDDSLNDLWKALRLSDNFSKKNINWKTIRRKYSLTYNNTIVQGPLMSYSVIEGSVLKFQRKLLGT